MTRRYRRKSSGSNIISDTAFIGSRSPWWGALLFGIVTFVALYFVVSSWLASKLAENEGSFFYQVLEQLMGRRIHWFQWVGIATGLIGLFYAVRNYLVANRADYKERHLVSLLARMIGRGLD